MQLSDLYLITGIFFQQRDGIVLGLDRNHDVAPVIRSSINEYLFTGILHKDPNHILGGYAGTILDGYGSAHLENIKIMEDEFSFEKLYDQGRPHDARIHYIFRHNQEIWWEGKYSIPSTDIQGPARCYLQPTTEEFFHHNLTVKPVWTHED